MFERITLLFISLFCILSAFFLGLYFGKNTTMDDLEQWKLHNQVSLQIHGNIIDIERTEPSIRLIVNGKILTNSGNFTIPK